MESLVAKITSLCYQIKMIKSPALLPMAFCDHLHLVLQARPEVVQQAAVLEAVLVPGDGCQEM